MGNLDNVDLPPESVQSFDEMILDKARRTVAANAIDAQDCSALFDILGIHPDHPDDLRDLGPIPAVQDSPVRTHRLGDDDPLTTPPRMSHPMLDRP